MAGQRNWNSHQVTLGKGKDRNVIDLGGLSNDMVPLLGPVGGTAKKLVERVLGACPPL